jgi:hypothetical protein
MYQDWSKSIEECYAVKFWLLDHWPWKSIGFQTLLRPMYVPSLVKIHWRILILECSQGCYAVKMCPSDLDLWPMTMKIKMFQTLQRTKFISSLVKIHWRMLILECSQGCYQNWTLFIFIFPNLYNLSYFFPK